ncbi:MAG TPA: hypothetical protein VJ583_03510 [Nitrososphaeraceae archaeon]|nr:hypothetical protein [Nitrososphaeraceae archaeon]
MGKQNKPIIQDIRYVITNDEENRFYKMGTYFVTDITLALYLSEEVAKYHLSRCLNRYQKDIFTKVIPVRVTVERLNE